MEHHKSDSIYKSFDEIYPGPLALESFELLNTIGTGNFSRVRLVKFKENAYAKPLALKILKKSLILKSKQIKHLYDEKEVMEHLDHGFITKLFRTFQDDRYAYLLMEYSCGGELFSRMKKMGTLPASHSSFYVSEVLLALDYLHSKNVIYRDLKPENVLLDRFGHIKLIDFGFSKLVCEKSYTICGTPEYLAPEMILNKGYGIEVDFWAVGILLFEMTTGELPFVDPCPMNLYSKILIGRIRFPEHIDKDARQLVCGLLEQDPNKRFGFRDAQNCEWLNLVDFHALANKENEAPWVPEVNGEFDTSCFTSYPESTELSPVPKINTIRDPFSGF